MTTACVSSDLRRAITPCQFGGDPDCTQCGCLASAGLAAVGDYRLAGVLPVRTVLDASGLIGQAVRRLREGPGIDRDPVERPAVGGRAPSTVND